MQLCRACTDKYYYHHEYFYCHSGSGMEHEVNYTDADDTSQHTQHTECAGTDLSKQASAANILTSCLLHLDYCVPGDEHSVAMLSRRTATAKLHRACFDLEHSSTQSGLGTMPLHHPSIAADESLRGHVRIGSTVGRLVEAVNAGGDQLLWGVLLDSRRHLGKPRLHSKLVSVHFLGAGSGSGSGSMPATFSISMTGQSCCPREAPCGA